MSKIDQDATFSTLDPSQKRALEQIVNDTQSNTHIVYGPPGTGKSQLVVSLLERLAKMGKTVLFVSQNTEALRVITRMIRRTERSIGYPGDNENLSLLDFCLMLYEPAARKLKYLREHSSVINHKNLPQISQRGCCSVINYPLSFVHLDQSANQNPTGALGFDELMSYYLKYVHCKLVPESLREFDQVDVRKIMQILERYPYQQDFNYYVHPRKELSLLSTENSSLNLPEVRALLQDIKLALTDTASKTFATKKTLELDEYLQQLVAYSALSPNLDLYRMVAENISVQDLLDFLNALDEKSKTYTAESDRIKQDLEKTKSSIVYSVQLADDTPALYLSKSALETADNDYKTVLEDYQTAYDLITKIAQFCPGFKFTGLERIYDTIAGAYLDQYQSHFTLAEDRGWAKRLWQLSADQITTLKHDLQTYTASSGIKRLLRSVPASFKELLTIETGKDLQLYVEYFDPIYTNVLPLLRSANLTMQALLDRVPADGGPAEASLKRLELKSLDPADLLTYLLDIARLWQLCQIYQLPTDDYEELASIVDQDLYALKEVDSLSHYQQNGKIIFNHGLRVFLEEVARAQALSRTEQAYQQLTEEYQSATQTLFASKQVYLENIDQVDQLLRELPDLRQRLLDYQIPLSRAFTDLDLPVHDQDLQREVLQNLQNVFAQVKTSHCFSPLFFQIQTGQNLQTWFNGVSILEAYSNNAELADFVEHNRMIAELYQAYGAANRNYLNEVLAQADLDFPKFTTRIVSTLVQNLHGSAPLAARKNVASQGFFADYADYLRSQKALSYRDGLEKLFDHSKSALIDLARQATLQSGNTVFEKFRLHTDKIIQAFPIVCATPKEVAKYLAPTKGLFDYVIFDEASQLLPGQALPAIFRAKRAVILGDPHQMPPTLNLGFGVITADEDDLEEDIGDSILDLVRKQPQSQHHLKVHYRSRYNKLFEPSRQAIYSSEGIEPIFEAEPSRGAPIDIADNLGEGVDDLGYDQNFQQICHAAKQYLDQIPEPDKVDGAIFCILFARSEILNNFKKYLAEERVERNFKPLVDLLNSEKILLSTVTNCQGIEGLYTIIYLQYYKFPGSMWFFKEGAGAYKRLNVAITRQREGLKLLLANPRSAWISACDAKIANSGTGPNALKSAELMRYLLENAGEVTGVTYLDRTLKSNAENFDSPLTEQLYHKLVEYYHADAGSKVRIYSEVGWNLIIPSREGISKNERNIGFRIDLGIYSVEQQKFILGVEMDGSTYHSGFNKEQSDYNRQFVLEKMKGWKIERIWSTNWLNDSEAEFNRLVERIDQLLQG